MKYLKKGLGFLAILLTLAILPFTAQASMFDGTDVSVGAVAATGGSYNASIMVGRSFGPMTLQGYYNKDHNTGADLVYTSGKKVFGMNPVIGIGGVQGETSLVAVVGAKAGNFSALAHWYDGKNDGSLGTANIGAYYTFHLK